MVSCDDYREALSARLDGEDDPGERTAVDVHLAGCADCQKWNDAAALVTRLARTSPVGPPFELRDGLLDVAPGPARARAGIALRLLLGVLGAVQFLLGAVQIAGSSGAHPLHDLDAVAGVGPGHLWHESAAWNVALGVGFAWIALRRTRPTGLLPTLTMFVGVLALLSANDVLLGRVDLTRLLSHGFVAIGYLIIVALSRPALDPGPSPTGDQDRGSRWRVSFDESEVPPERPRLRLLASPPVTQAQARHDRAA